MYDRDFNVDNDLAVKMETNFELYLQQQNVEYTKTPHTFWTQFHQVDGVRDCAWEYDFIVKEKGVELKTLAGDYPTAVIEKWADDNMSVKPGWLRSALQKKLDYIVIENRAEGMWYFYDAQVMCSTVSSWPNTLLTRCWNNNANAPGYIVKFPWEDEDFGFIKKLVYKRS